MQTFFAVIRTSISNNVYEIAVLQWELLFHKSTYQNCKKHTMQTSSMKTNSKINICSYKLACCGNCFTFQWWFNLLFCASPWLYTVLHTMQQQLENKVIHQIPVSQKQTKIINGTTTTFIYSMVHLGIKTQQQWRINIYAVTVIYERIVSVFTFFVPRTTTLLGFPYIHLHKKGGQSKVGQQLSKPIYSIVNSDINHMYLLHRMSVPSAH